MKGLILVDIPENMEDKIDTLYFQYDERGKHYEYKVIPMLEYQTHGDDYLHTEYNNGYTEGFVEGMNTVIEYILDESEK